MFTFVPPAGAAQLSGIDLIKLDELPESAPVGDSQ
jgi:hypothetical protein